VKPQRKPLMRASISFPPDLYESLEEIATKRNCLSRGSSATPQRSTSRVPPPGIALTPTHVAVIEEEHLWLHRIP
jgi:hypothetical protein